VTGSAPLVIGHRGAPGYRPEHTLASYELAARLGADQIEPDLVLTADGALVARHEPEIGATTDVAAHPEFADRRTTKAVDGVVVTGWFAEDFTLAELKTLRARERLPRLRLDNTVYDGRFEVRTFDEALRLRERLSRELGREIGVYPEAKHPGYIAGCGTPLELPVVAERRAAGLDRPDAPVFVQSFDPATLRELRARLPVPLVQLIGPAVWFDAMASPAGLGQVATYADGPQPTGRTRAG
jgi:glycerophosphoryl diester phosphodiesterase